MGPCPEYLFVVGPHDWLTKHGGWAGCLESLTEAISLLLIYLQKSCVIPLYSGGWKQVTRGNPYSKED